MTQTINLFGLTFKPMDESDYEGFAGAEEGAFICYHDDDNIYIFEPSKEPSGARSRGTITVVDSEGQETVWKGVAR